jgi:ectoine hydroxylase-related dioxygenase (phytanoyl-CoA dioxygenase family)
MVIPNGFRVAHALLDTSEVDALRGAICDSIDRVARVMLTPYDTSWPSAEIEERIERAARQDRAYASALLQVALADAQRDARLAALQDHPQLSSAIRSFLAPAEPTGIVVRARAAIPSFASRISPWHQDVIRPDATTGCATVRMACWIPLADVDETTGALELIPGTRETPCPHVAGEDGHFAIPEKDLPPGERCIVPMRRGDVLFLDRFVPHRARPTRGVQGRWSIVMWVKAGGSVTTC